MKLLKSFRYAIEGFVTAIASERNLRIHFALAMIALALAYFLSISLTELLIIFLLIGLVISLELVNSAIERFVDLVEPEYNLIAKKAKDIAAAAVFHSALLAFFIGIYIFLPAILAKYWAIKLSLANWKQIFILFLFFYLLGFFIFGTIKQKKSR